MCDLAAGKSSNYEYLEESIAVRDVEFLSSTLFWHLCADLKAAKICIALLEAFDNVGAGCCTHT